MKKYITTTNIRNRLYGVIGFLTISYFIAGYIFVLRPAMQNTLPKKLCFAEQCRDIEIADTNEKREVGLMSRTELPGGSGMLFVFATGGTYSFWMKNTLIPLDIIWLDADFHIVHAVSAPPCTNTGVSADSCPSYMPSVPAYYVLEINSGSMKTWGMQVGDILVP